MLGIVAGMRHIFTSPVTINSCSMIAIGRVSGLLRPISTSIIVTTMINSTIAIERVTVS